jgi:hypothetical protein
MSYPGGWKKEILADARPDLGSSSANVLALFPSTHRNVPFSQSYSTPGLPSPSRSLVFQPVGGRFGYQTRTEDPEQANWSEPSRWTRRSTHPSPLAARGRQIYEERGQQQVDVGVSDQVFARCGHTGGGGNGFALICRGCI